MKGTTKVDEKTINDFFHKILVYDKWSIEDPLEHLS